MNNRTAHNCYVRDTSGPYIVLFENQRLYSLLVLIALFILTCYDGKSQNGNNLYSFQSCYLADIEVDEFGNKYVLLYSDLDSVFGGGELLFKKPNRCAPGSDCQAFYYLLVLDKTNTLRYYKYFSASKEFENSVLVSTTFSDIDVMGSSILITGAFRSDSFYSTDLDLATKHDGGSINLITFEYSLNGNLINYKHVQSPDWYDCVDMVMERNEDISIFAGRHMDTMQLGDHQLNVRNLRDNNVFLAAVDDDLNFDWATNMGGKSWDYFIDVEIDQDNNILLLGDYTQPEIQIGGQSTSLSNTDFDGFFIMKFDELGNPIWQTQATGGHVRCKSISVMVDGIILYHRPLHESDRHL